MHVLKEYKFMSYALHGDWKQVISAVDVILSEREEKRITKFLKIGVIYFLC